MTDDDYMGLAIDEARQAALEDEVPIGAILVDINGRILAKTHNQTITHCDPTAHAEILALRSAARSMDNYRLVNTTLYVTIEPCIMCMGAIVQARVGRVVFGAVDPKWGAAGSLYDLARDTRLNHAVEVQGGVLEEECRDIIQAFFRAKRAVSIQ